jgi:transposase
MLGGAAPIPASSGQTVRVRLNRSGDRQLNQALYTVALTRLRTDPATRAYATRRRGQGKTNREIKRCLVRYIARQLYRLLEAPADQLTQHRWHVSGTPCARCGTLAASDRNGGSQRRSRWPS